MNEAMKKYPPRPGLNDERKRRGIEKWADECFDNSIHSDSHVRDELIEILVKSADEHIDGFELGVEIMYHIDVDFQLSEELDSVSHYLAVARREAVREWLSENNIKPPLSVGSKVRWVPCWTEYKGTIIESSSFCINRYPGCYSIVKDDNPDAIYFVKFEDVELDEQATEANNAN